MLAFYLTLVDSEAGKSKFEIIYHKYAKRMYTMAYSVLHNHEDAEDAVHEAFIAIARNIKSIDDPASQRTLSYVLKAVKNTAINIKNKKNREPKYTYIDEIKSMADKDFLEMLEIQDDYNNVIKAINALDEKYSDVLYMHFVEGMQAGEIADLLGRKKATVKQQLVRGKKLLLNNLKDCEG